MSEKRIKLIKERLSQLNPTHIDIEDEATGKDKDRDGETISYSCFFDKSEDKKVSDAVPCNKIQGLNFNTETGLLSWITNLYQGGVYEFKIVGNDGNKVDNKDEKIFKINVLP